jgi:hypothetical protein
LITHTDDAPVTRKVRAMEGRAIFAMVLSSTDMEMASRIAAIAQ